MTPIQTCFPHIATPPSYQLAKEHDQDRPRRQFKRLICNFRISFIETQEKETTYISCHIQRRNKAKHGTHSSQGIKIATPYEVDHIIWHIGKGKYRRYEIWWYGYTAKDASVELSGNVPTIFITQNVLHSQRWIVTNQHISCSREKRSIGKYRIRNTE